MALRLHEEITVNCLGCTVGEAAAGIRDYV